LENVRGNKPVEADASHFVPRGRKAGPGIQEMNNDVPEGMSGPSKGQPPGRAAYTEDCGRRVGTRARDFDPQPLPSCATDRSEDDVGDISINPHGSLTRPNYMYIHILCGWASPLDRTARRCRCHAPARIFGGRPVPSRACTTTGFGRRESRTRNSRC
jgi:hypothetical protein